MLTDADVDVLFGREPDPIGVAGFMTWGRHVPGVGRVASFPPPLPSAYLDDAADLDGRIDDMMTFFSTHPPAVDWGEQWGNFFARWKHYLADLRGFAGTFTATPDGQNAYWAEYDGWMTRFKAIGYQGAPDRPDPGASTPNPLSTWIPLAVVAVVLVIAAPYALVALR